MIAFLAPIWGFMKGIPAKVWIIILVIGGAIIGIYIVDARARHEARQEQKRKQREASLKEAVVISETRRTIQETRSNDIQAAEQAVRDLPTYSSVDELRNQRPDIAAELLGDPRSGDRKAESR